MLKPQESDQHLQMAASSPVEAGWFFGMRDEEEHQLQMKVHHQHLQQSSAPNSAMAISAAAPSTQKKKRTQPDPDAEVIALSPKTLMATNRFICEVCNKGFQREQNLQLHRRGHNLPWKLKQKSTKEVRKKVYLCPEPSCVHHDPSRALGDLTGIKKHFSRKHGEKKWKCDKCSKRYAVQSDWKAHSKTCGTKEYRCDCGTLFSRRDSFVTHRAFCDALAQENALNPTNLSVITSQLFGHGRVAPHQMMSPHHQRLGMIHEHNSQSSKSLLGHNGDGFRRFGSFLPPLSGSTFRPPSSTISFTSPPNYHQDEVFGNGIMMQQQLISQDQIPNEHTADHSFFSSTVRKNDNGSPNEDSNNDSHLSSSPNLFGDQISNGVNTCGKVGGSINSTLGSSMSLFSSNIISDQISPLYSTQASLQSNINASAPAHMSATALLQKAAQVGSSCSGTGASSLLRTMGSSLPLSKNDNQHQASSCGGATSFGALLGDQNKHLHELMSSLGGGEQLPTSMFGNLARGNSGYTNVDDHQEKNSNTFCGDGGYATIADGNNRRSFGACDKLTRDFLGVGQIVRHMSGGYSPDDILLQSQQQGHQMSSKTSIGGDVYNDFNEN